METKSYDVVIIGSGVGGGSVALQLAGSKARVLVLERGPSLPREGQNWEPESVFGNRRYQSDETWWADGPAFKPGMFYFIGGNSKFYGTAMFRFRERDFDEVVHEAGLSPAWPIAYSDLEPWYEWAETLFGVRGKGGADPTDPPRSKDYDLAPVPHEPVIDAIERRLRCENCDAFPCMIDAKGDAETRLIRPALDHSHVELRSGVYVEKLFTDASGRRIVAADVVTRGRRERGGGSHSPPSRKG